jgi:CubicO group peptidase (beta-lactamase class C family)
VNLVPTAEPRCQFNSRGFADSWRKFKDDEGDSWWTFSTPEEQGIDAAVMRAGWPKLENPGFVRSVLVIRHGMIVEEAYFNDTDVQFSGNVYSTSKSMLSALVGIALQEGYLESLDQTVGELLPGYFADIDDPAKAEVTLRQMLTMTSGLKWVDDYPNFKAFESEDWIDSVWSYELVDAPGKKFIYHTGLTHTMSAVLTQATGMSTCDFAYEYLFDPLGITVEHWTTDPQGYFMGGTHVFMTPRELAKIGLLYLHEGRWEGEQIVPQAWVKESTQYSGLGDNPDYGYWWWLDRIGGYRTFKALGHGGQTAFVFPDLDLIVVTTAQPGDAGRPTMNVIHEVVEEYVIPAVKEGE